MESGRSDAAATACTVPSAAYAAGASDPVFAANAGVPMSDSARTPAMVARSRRPPARGVSFRFGISSLSFPRRTAPAPFAKMNAGNRSEAQRTKAVDDAFASRQPRRTKPRRRHHPDVLARTRKKAVPRRRNGKSGSKRQRAFGTHPITYRLPEHSSTAIRPCLPQEGCRQAFWLIASVKRTKHSNRLARDFHPIPLHLRTCALHPDHLYN